MHHPGELKCEIPIIISNHPDLEGVAASFGIPFRCLPLPAGSGPEGKRQQVGPCAGALLQHIHSVQQQARDVRLLLQLSGPYGT